MQETTNASPTAAKVRKFQLVTSSNKQLPKLLFSQKKNLNSEGRSATEVTRIDRSTNEQSNSKSHFRLASNFKIHGISGSQQIKHGIPLRTLKLPVFGAVKCENDDPKKLNQSLSKASIFDFSAATSAYKNDPFLTKKLDLELFKMQKPQFLINCLITSSPSSRNLLTNLKLKNATNNLIPLESKLRLIKSTKVYKVLQTPVNLNPIPLRYHHTMVMHNPKIHLIGGVSGGRFNATLLSYDISNQSYSQISDPVFKRRHHSTMLVGSRIIICGGLTSLPKQHKTADGKIIIHDFSNLIRHK